MASGQSVVANFPWCSTINQLSGVRYHSGEWNLPLDVSKASEAAWIQDWMWDRDEGIPDPAWTPTCLYMLRLHSVLIYPQVSRWLWPSTHFLIWTRKEPSIYCTVKRNFDLYVQKLFYWPLKDNQTCEGGAGVSLHRLSATPTRLALYAVSDSSPFHWHA